MIVQENRSFDSYFGTYPATDGIPAKNKRFTVCIPDPAPVAATGRCRTLAECNGRLCQSPTCRWASSFARHLLECGVAAGEHAVGLRVFVQDAGDFWLMVETRPYTRARAALAAVVWRLGRREEALEHQGEPLRLNPPR
jgi:hypothetical protein